MTQKLEIDCTLNTHRMVDLTPGEEAQRAIDEAASAAEQAAKATADSTAAALRAQIVTIAQGAVGVRVDQLTAAQVRALVAVLFHKAGAIATDLTIRPLADWA